MCHLAFKKKKKQEKTQKTECTYDNIISALKFFHWFGQIKSKA